MFDILIQFKYIELIIIVGVQILKSDANGENDMKGQGTYSSRRLTDESLRRSLNAGDSNHEDPDYIQLDDSSKTPRARVKPVLDSLTTLGISAKALKQAGVIEQDLQKLLAKELSCSQYFRWAFVDNFLEKILQGLILNKQDISQEAISFCSSMIRQMPSGRSLLLHQACGLRKVYAARGFVLTTEMVLNKAVTLSVACFLSYRLYESLTLGSSNFSEFTEIFNENNKKGITSIVNVLAKVEAQWLYLLLTSPAIIGVLKGLWDTQKSQSLTESTVTQLQEAVNHHTNTLLKKSYLWGDVLRQLIPMPGFSSVSERVQKAEQQVRWDGRIMNTERASLFSRIEKLALQGSGMSQINAMQSLAKIVHSLSIKDFKRLQNAGYSQETLVQILRIKTQALRDLSTLSNRARIQSEAQQNFEVTLQQSPVSRIYAAYLLWWLGMGNFKYSFLFWPFKLGKLAFQGLFLKTLVESILEAIKCPDKQGFNMSTGEYPVWATQLTPDCFKEFVRQFRFISKDEPFQPFLERLSNFDLRRVESIDLGAKALTSNEIKKILNVLNKFTSIKILNLSYNEINETLELLLPGSLQSLDLFNNRIGDEGAKGLQFPPSLQFVNLSLNNIGAEGAKGLRFPSSLQSLNLVNNNNIGDEGAKGLQLPPSLQSLDLAANNIGDEGAKGLRFPPSLQSLGLVNNNIGDSGAKGLHLPASLQSLNLGGNDIGDEGAKGLQLPASLQSLDLSFNNIGAEGAKGLKLPLLLQYLSLRTNCINVEGAKGLNLTLTTSLQSLDLSNTCIDEVMGLQLPSSLKSLFLSSNNIGSKGTKELFFPMLQSLDLSFNYMGDEGAKALQLPSRLISLDLSFNAIGGEGVKALQFPSTLNSLNLLYNNIGDEGAKNLQLPTSLYFLSLSNNKIGTEGVKALQLPLMLRSLDLTYNYCGAEGAKGLRLPLRLQSLSLARNNIGDEGVRGLQFPSSLQSLNLNWNNIGDEGVRGLQLPSSLQSLYLNENNIGDEGANALQLPASLQFLDLAVNKIGAEGAKGLTLPLMLQSLVLARNNISDEGVNALLKKIPRTNLTTIVLDYNPYNSTSMNVNRTLQQQMLLKNCQDKLCHANTPLWAEVEYQTSGAARAQPSLFFSFSWLKKPFDKLSEYVSDGMNAAIDSLGARLEKVLSQSPSYFPNIHSPTIHDWQPSGSGSVMLHQFNAGGSNTLLMLLGAQTAAIQPSLSAIAR